jgi:hypothetical protein
MRSPRKLHIAILVGICAALLLSAGTVFSDEVSIKSLSDVAGSWSGSVSGPRGNFADVNLTITPDGKYNASGWDLMGGGTLTLENGKLRWKGMQSSGVCVQDGKGKLYCSGDGGLGYGIFTKGQ